MVRIYEAIQKFPILSKYTLVESHSDIISSRLVVYVCPPTRMERYKTGQLEILLKLSELNYCWEGKIVFSLLF